MFSVALFLENPPKNTEPQPRILSICKLSFKLAQLKKKGGGREGKELRWQEALIRMLLASLPLRKCVYFAGRKRVFSQQIPNCWSFHHRDGGKVLKSSRESGRIRCVWEPTNSSKGQSGDKRHHVNIHTKITMWANGQRWISDKPSVFMKISI